jgi:hypothetical protein
MSGFERRIFGARRDPAGWGNFDTTDICGFHSFSQSFAIYNLGFYGLRRGIMSKALDEWVLGLLAENKKGLRGVGLMFHRTVTFTPRKISVFHSRFFFDLERN